MRDVRILLVEDEAPKRAHIEKFLKRFGTSVRVTVAGSVNAALDRLDVEVPDLLLVDMSLPTFDVGGNEGGGRPQGLGGLEVLRYMAMADIVCPAIVVTGYEAFPREFGKPVELAQIRGELMEEFPQILRGVLHYNSTFEEWRIQLSDVLQTLGIGGGEAGK